MNLNVCPGATLNSGDDEDVCSDTDDAGVSLAPDADAVSAQSVESTSQDTLATDSDPSAWGNYLWGLAFGETEESEAPESALPGIRVLGICIPGSCCCRQVLDTSTNLCAPLQPRILALP